MFFLLGARNQETRAGGSPFDCPGCGPGQRFVRVRVQRVLTVFFIPTFPIRQVADRVECQSCSGSFEASAVAGAIGSAVFVPPSPEDDRASAVAQVKAPAILMMASALMSAAYSVPAAVGLLTDGESDLNLFSLLLGLQLAAAALAFGAGLQLKRLRSYWLCLAASVVLLIPGLSAFCVLGIPLGIWSLTLLTQARVRAQFGSAPSVELGVLAGDRLGR